MLWVLASQESTNQLLKGWGSCFFEAIMNEETVLDRNLIMKLKNVRRLEKIIRCIKNEVFHSGFLPFPADLVTFTEEILNGKLYFLCSDKYEHLLKKHKSSSFFCKMNSLLVELILSPNQGEMICMRLEIARQTTFKVFLHNG